MLIFVEMIKLVKKMNIVEKILKVEKEAIEFGFDWPNNDAIIEQAKSECIEIEEAINNNESKERIQEEVGDLIHCALSLLVFNQIDPLETLDHLYNKFSKRINNLKKITNQENLNSLHDKPIEYKLQLWNEAKKLD
jgi:uncharacterized protein YabN with tetrapyrrole methylase and pyrophosphatase domain